MFGVDDYVVVVGSTKTESAIKDWKFKVCKIIAVGADELIVNDLNSYSERWLKIPKISCQKVYLIDHSKVPSPRQPKPGQMVMELKCTYSERMIRTGILLEVIVNPGHGKRAIILHNNKKIEADYENLMIMEE